MTLGASYLLTCVGWCHIRSESCSCTRQKVINLLAASVSGSSASLVTGMTVTVGHRLTGWVAANRKTIRNSDPILDLGEVAEDHCSAPAELPQHSPDLRD